jgi:hypothetical protein
VFLFGVQDEIGRMETVQNGRVLSAWKWRISSVL